MLASTQRTSLQNIAAVSRDSARALLALPGSARHGMQILYCHTVTATASALNHACAEYHPAVQIVRC